MIVSSKITAIADGRIDVMMAEEFLGEVHMRFGVLWVYDGTALYLYDRTENAREGIPFPFEARERIRTEMNTAGVRGAPISMRFLPNEDLLQISGPPRFVEWARQSAEEIAKKALAQGAAMVTNAAPPSLRPKRGPHRAKRHQAQSTHGRLSRRRSPQASRSSSGCSR